MTFLEALFILKKHTIEFVWWEGTIVKSLKDREVVGINARASSLIRLNFTIHRVNYIIQEEKLPLKVFVNHSHLNHFKVVLNQ